MKGNDKLIQRLNLFSALLVFNCFDLPPPMESSGYTEGPEGAAEEGSLLSRVKHGGTEDSERVTLPNDDASLGGYYIQSNDVAQKYCGMGCDVAS